MDGKGKRCGSKKESKVFDFEDDADDDEPIGSLLKVMKHKTATKSKVETETTGKQMKKLTHVRKDSEDMDDTLASFRKRLKGHKKRVRNDKDVPPVDTVTLIPSPDMADDASELGREGTVNRKSLDDIYKSKVKSSTRSVILEKEADADDKSKRPLPNVDVYPPVDRKDVSVLSPDHHIHLGEPESESGHFREEKIVMCECGIQFNFEDRSLESNSEVAICQKCKRSSHRDASNGGGIQVNALKDGTAEASPVSVTPYEDEDFRGDAVSLPNSGKPSTLQRPERIARKRKHENMVYGEDMNWENEQGFLDCQSDKSFKGSDKCDFGPFISKEIEIGRAAAVAAGLKAQSVSPVEKTILKEVLKRKGSHQEYLRCRDI